MSTNVPIRVAHGDGIGPEIMEASLHIIQEAGARIDLEVIEINGGTKSKKTVALLGRVLEQGLEIVKTETLRTYNGAAGYTLSQGQ